MDSISRYSLHVYQDFFTTGLHDFSSNLLRCDMNGDNTVKAIRIYIGMQKKPQHQNWKYAAWVYDIGPFLSIFCGLFQDTFIIEAILHQMVGWLMEWKGV
jgi:hypothetical protein